MPNSSNKKLNIAMLGHKRIPSREGGVEIVVEELSTRMVALGHSVTCYNRKGHHVSGKEFDREKIDSYKGVRVKRVFTIPKGGLAAMSASFFAAVEAAFGKYDVVHFHAEGPCAMLWLPKLFGKKCIATIHGLDHQRAKWGNFASWYIRTGEKCAVRFADEIIVLSENTKSYFLNKYNRETVYIPNGIIKMPALEAFDIKEKFGLETGEYILFLGRLVPEKGLRYLINAFKSVKTNKKLVIAGGSSDTDWFAKELHELAIDDPRILFVGFVEGRTSTELYSNAYFYVLPSDLEGMPLSLLEAMSYGNCCLVSDIPECADVVGEHGVTFKRSDVGDLSDMLQYLCDNPEKVCEIASDSADYICGKFNWENVVRETLQLYGVNEVVASSAPVEEKEYESIARK